MLCGERRTGPKFTLVMRASAIYLGPMGNIMFVVKLGKTEPQVGKEVSEMWRRTCPGLGDVFCRRSWTKLWLRNPL